MSRRWFSYLFLSVLMLGSIAIGCRAPYPTYNPYGMYGNPCVNPPGTGTFNPATGRTDPYYGAPANGIYPPNPYANPSQGYPGYPPPPQGPAGSTSKSNWQPTASLNQPATTEWVSKANLGEDARSDVIIASQSTQLGATGQNMKIDHVDTQPQLAAVLSPSMDSFSTSDE